MTRTLLLIAGAGFLVCVVCLAGAAVLGGRELVTHPWFIGWDDGGRFGMHQEGGWGTRDGASGSGQRIIAWTGADEFDLDAPANVHFTQSSGPAQLVITGPQDELNRLELDGGRLGYRDGGGFNFDYRRLDVEMSAPSVHKFAIDGDGRITIDGYNADDLSVDVSGHGDVKATGQAKSVRVDISGLGAVDLSGVKADSAYAEISGAGRARLAPANSADLHISGAGKIDLLTRPPQLVSDVSGAGRIVEDANAGSNSLPPGALPSRGGATARSAVGGAAPATSRPA